MWVGGYRPHLRTPAYPHGSNIAPTSEHHRPLMEVVSPSRPNTIAPTWKLYRPHLQTPSYPHGSHIALTSDKPFAVAAYIVRPISSQPQDGGPRAYRQSIY